MGSKWLHCSEKDLRTLLDSLAQELGDRNTSFVEAVAMVDQRGAFVELNSREDAEKLFLNSAVVIYGSNLVNSYEKCLEGDFRQACFVSGESKTADIEQILVSGVHGPKECFFVVVQ